MRERNKRVIFCTPFIFINIHLPRTRILLFDCVPCHFFLCQCVWIYGYFFNDNSARTYTSRTALLDQYCSTWMIKQPEVQNIYSTKVKQVEYCLNKFWKSKSNYNQRVCSDCHCICKYLWNYFVWIALSNIYHCYYVKKRVCWNFITVIFVPFHVVGICTEKKNILTGLCTLYLRNF